MTRFYRFYRRIVKIVLQPFFPLKVVGKEKLALMKKGKGIIICNHFGLMDVITIGMFLKEQIYFIGKESLFKNKLANWFFRNLGAFPTSRNGRDIKAIKDGMTVLKNDHKLGVFPEGTRNKVDNSDMNDLKGGVIMFAIRCEAPVYPMMLLRKSKMFRKNYLIIGDSFELEEFYGKKLTATEYDELAEKLKERMNDLRHELIEKIEKKS